MKELDPAVFLAVFQEILGGFFWPLVIVVVLGAIAFLYVLARDRRLASGRFLWSQIVGLAGGLFALWFTFFITSSQLADSGGPIDWVLLIVLFVLGAIGGTMAAYALLGLIDRRARAS